ncbi:MAG: carbonic anhydrase family protein [Deltaproteobacteria bacterium]|nr:carbonic anhydrase family protein [Deltaproteobacteria bacterium]
MRRKYTFTVWARIGIVAVAFACLATAKTTAQAIEFSYSGDEGPGFWGELDPAWTNCSENSRQSPIDIKNAHKDKPLGPLDLNLHETEIDLINTGHGIQQRYKPGSTLTFAGVVYELQQFHFHTLSEHTIKGKRGAMELHVVFSNAGTGNLAVIGQIYDVDEENQFLAAFDQILPRHSGDNTTSPTEINVGDGLDDTRKYFTYPGSLTTPPCSPTVTFIVLEKRATMSEEQFHLFNDIMGNNFRPLQPLNGRTIHRSH